MREVCKREHLVYQGFSLLTANVTELASPEIRQIAAAHGATIPQIVFRFAMQLGMISLTGTTNPQHMREDLRASEPQLTEDEIATIEESGRPRPQRAGVSPDRLYARPVLGCLNFEFRISNEETRPPILNFS